MADKILFVDDEKDILKSLRRTFAGEDYEVHTAQSGHEALAFLEETEVDVIVSDQRMPEMGGVAFLLQSKTYSPDAIRMVLTGYADVEAAIGSINSGEVYRYITKPWDNDELLSIVKGAIELKKLKGENVRLLELTQKQNRELKDFNDNLEQKVAEQTKDLRSAYEKMKAMYTKINKSFITTVMVLSNISSMRRGVVAQRFKITSKLAMAIAEEAKLAEDRKTCLKIASLLNDIGTLGINEKLVTMAFDDMTPTERAEYMRHSVLGETLLESIDNMHEVAVVVRHHHEKWDGTGFPDNLAGDLIPFCSRILSVASDYEGLMNGVITPVKTTNLEAKQYVIDNSGKRYDPEVVSIFVRILPEVEKSLKLKPEVRVSSKELAVGMVLSRDIMTENGLLLMHEGVKLRRSHLDGIAQFERTEKKRYEIYVLLESARHLAPVKPVQVE